MSAVEPVHSHRRPANRDWGHWAGAPLAVLPVLYGLLLANEALLTGHAALTQTGSCAGGQACGYRVTLGLSVLALQYGTPLLWLGLWFLPPRRSLRRARWWLVAGVAVFTALPLLVTEPLLWGLG